MGSGLTLISSMLFLGLCGVILCFDWQRRTIPRSVPIIGAVLGGVMSGVSYPGVVGGVMIGFATAILADLPIGDAAVGGMLGAWLGIEGTIWTWMSALLAGQVVWAVWEHRWIDWPGDWPFTPFLLVPACAIVFSRGG